MQLKDGIIITEMEGSYFAVDTGISGTRFNGMIKMNKTSAEIARLLQTGGELEEIARIICSSYDVDWDNALEDIRKVEGSFRKAGLMK